VWYFENRTLTENITASVNETKIAESVWNWEGSVADNILEKIAGKVWEFVGGVAEIIS
jgi:hypothetical protein